ncbi:MAG: low molecular weight phosphatase family protein [Haloferacaceae archaeon]
MTDAAVRLAFVCVRNAGRSQMAAAFAERERRERGLEDRVEVVTGGTDPAEEVHPVVVDAMAEAGLDVSDRVPRTVPTTELRSCDVVATMGCSTLSLGVDPDEAGVDVRDWALADPGGQDLAAVRAIRDEVERRVVALFDELAP